jgi:hypothetical protein
VKLSRFQTIVDAYGAAPERWPDAEREAALALVHSSLPAARALRQARALDDRLVADGTPHVAEDWALAQLRARIVAAAGPRIESWFIRWLGFDLTPMHLWPSLGGLALATVLGFTVGIGGLVQTDTDRDSDDIVLLSPIDLPAAGQ